jgi:hypothetical protein
MKGTPRQKQGSNFKFKAKEKAQTAELDTKDPTVLLLTCQAHSCASVNIANLAHA